MIAFLLILGGAVFGDRIVTINSSTISSNIAGGFFNRTSGGSIYIGGGTATVSNSTLSGNRANSFGTGGGIANDGTFDQQQHY